MEVIDPFESDSLGWSEVEYPRSPKLREQWEVNTPQILSVKWRCSLGCWIRGHILFTADGRGVRHFRNQMSDTTNTNDPSIAVSNHAVLRWLERVNPTEQSPRTAIKRAWERGRPAAVEHGDGRRVGDAILVRKGDSISTVLAGGAR